MTLGAFLGSHLDAAHGIADRFAGLATAYAGYA